MEEKIMAAESKKTKGKEELLPAKRVAFLVAFNVNEKGEITKVNAIPYLFRLKGDIKDYGPGMKNLITGQKEGGYAEIYDENALIQLETSKVFSGANPKKLDQICMEAFATKGSPIMQMSHSVLLHCYYTPSAIKCIAPKDKSRPGYLELPKQLEAGKDYMTADDACKIAEELGPNMTKACKSYQGFVQEQIEKGPKAKTDVAKNVLEF